VTQRIIIRIESFEGRDTFIRCGDDHQDFLFAVVAVNEPGHAEIVDSGYRSYDEAAQAWPEARPLSRADR
jgi:hypothetical protein